MKLDLILENIKNKYSLGLLEESSLTEIQQLKGKILINESIMNIRKMLVEEGTIISVQNYLQETWEEVLGSPLPDSITPEDDDLRHLQNGALITAGVGALAAKRYGKGLGKGTAESIVGTAKAVAHAAKVLKDDSKNFFSKGRKTFNDTAVKQFNKDKADIINGAIDIKNKTAKVYKDNIGDRVSAVKETFKKEVEKAKKQP